MVRRAVFVSTFPPRRCGIAEFTNDLLSALADVATEWNTAVCAIDRDGLAYGSEVLATIRQDVREDYARAARSIARTRPDLVVIEHEFGIFGGPAGCYVLDLAGGLRSRGIPCVVTLHTVRPDPRLRHVVTSLCDHADLVTVFTHHARRLVLEGGVSDPRRTVVVPHGAPCVLRNPPDSPTGVLAEVMAGLAGARAITSFGLIKPAKGLELVIRAMPAITRRHADLHYVVAGATHPEVARRSGEQYRRRLAALTAELGMGHRVKFVNEFLSEGQIGWLLGRAELCVTPYLSDEQVSSGVLTFALAAGCPVVSTDYSYARQLLGTHSSTAPVAIVPRRDAAGFAAVITELLADPVRMAASRAAAQLVGSQLLWPEVARLFANVLALVRSHRPAARVEPVRRRHVPPESAASVRGG